MKKKMEAILYTGKMNLVSEEIHGVLDGSINFFTILENVYSAFNSNVSYSKERTSIIDGEPITQVLTYSTRIIKKSNMVIEGFIYKNSYVYYNKFDIDTCELHPNRVESVDAAEFRLDVSRESLVYHRAKRFGYTEILEAFEGLINKCCEFAGLSYMFEMVQGKQGINLDTVRSDLDNTKIKKMSVIYQVPNCDPEILDKIRKNREKNLTDFKDANMESREVIFRTNSQLGLNTKSELIERELDNIEALHSSIDSTMALENGYVVVNTIDIYGNSKSSKDSRPFVKKISDKKNFQEEAKNIQILLDPIRQDQ